MSHIPVTEHSREALADEYVSLFEQCAPATYTASAITRLVSGQERYLKVQSLCGVPWWFTGLLHTMECSGRFDQHLHNGDPLSARTVQVPAGRPHYPTWTWETSAVDALTFQTWSEDQVRRLPDGTADWTLPTTLWRLEAYNGFGPRKRGIRSCYLWGKSNLEQPGKYVADGQWNPEARTAQIGCAVLLKEMINQGIVTL